MCLCVTKTVMNMHVSAVARQMQEQQLRARQLVLQQQAASAVAAASKTQREVCLAMWIEAWYCSMRWVRLSLTCSPECTRCDPNVHQLCHTFWR